MLCYCVITQKKMAPLYCCAGKLVFTMSLNFDIIIITIMIEWLMHIYSVWYSFKIFVK